MLFKHCSGNNSVTTWEIFTCVELHESSYKYYIHQSSCCKHGLDEKLKTNCSILLHCIPFPKNPALHLHENEFPVLVQIAFVSHGLERQWSISNMKYIIRILILYYLIQTSFTYLNGNCINYNSNYRHFKTNKNN